MAIEIIPDRVCPHCNGTKWYVSNITSSSKKHYYKCALKNLERTKLWKKNNLEKYNEIRRKIALRMKLYKQEHKLPRKCKTFKNHLPEEELKILLLKAKSDNTLKKTCESCNEEKSTSYFNLKIRKTGKIYLKPICSTCSKRRYRSENREKNNERAMEYYRNRTEEQRKKYNILAANCRKRNYKKTRELSVASWNRIKNDPERREKKNKIQRDYSKHNREILSDSYVKGRVIGKEGKGVLFREDIPQELVDIKRKQLVLIRQIL